MLTQIMEKGIGTRLGTLMQPPPELSFDYAKPAGEAALVAPDSVSWRIFKNPVSLFIGGVAAVILELAEPSVRAGVWGHSSFRSDPVTRLRRTGAAAMMTVYGPRRAAERMIAGVVRAHDKVRGVTPEGLAYHANDQQLLDWVQATASHGFIAAYDRFVAPLAAEEMSRAFSEGAEAARLYGALGAPASLADWEAMLLRVEPGLGHSAILDEFLGIIMEAPLAPVPLRPFQRLMVRATFELVPATLRETLQLEQRRLSPLQLKLVEAAGKLADRVPIPGAPPMQASIRMGREPGLLYRRRV